MNLDIFATPYIPVGVLDVLELFIQIIILEERVAPFYREKVEALWHVESDLALRDSEVIVPAIKLL